MHQTLGSIFAQLNVRAHNSIFYLFGKISNFPVFSLTGIFWGPFSLFSLCSGYPDGVGLTLSASDMKSLMGSPGVVGVGGADSSSERE